MESITGLLGGFAVSITTTRTNSAAKEEGFPRIEMLDLMQSRKPFFSTGVEMTKFGQP